MTYPGKDAGTRFEEIATARAPTIDSEGGRVGLHPLG